MVYSHYSGWLGVALGPVLLMVSVLGALNAVGTSIMDFAAAGDGYCV